ncbi:Phospholipase A2, major isoenzyme [Liparis tanakae]|uniref:Phospholipase A2 n=1 Tax=Liparis tanakae TaxID=230148 RepID=A0A4Z2I0B5_9TELE|nr:Phospholipase A2, major isoenzyme [Liparis tanakae]
MHTATPDMKRIVGRVLYGVLVLLLLILLMVTGIKSMTVRAPLLLLLLTACTASGALLPKALWQFGFMIECAQPGTNPLLYSDYGCWCGFGGTGSPVDEVDTPLYLLHPYRGKVHNSARSDDHKTDGKGHDPQVESFPPQPLGAIIVLFLIAPLSLEGE